MQFRADAAVGNREGLPSPFKGAGNVPGRVEASKRRLGAAQQWLDPERSNAAHLEVWPHLRGVFPSGSRAEKPLMYRLIVIGLGVIDFWLTFYLVVRWIQQETN